MAEETFVEAEELRFKIPDGTLLAAKSWGDESASIGVVAVHGFLDSAASFDTLAPRLVAGCSDIRVVAIDLSGHGKSSHRPNHTNYHSSWVMEVITVADALGWDQFSLMCHSMGTMVGVTLAGAMPYRIRHMILFDAIGPGSVPPEKSPLLLERALKQRLQFLQRQPRVYKNVDELVSRMMKSDSQLTEASARRLVERGSELVPGGYTFSHDARLRGPSLSYMTEDQVLAFVARITCPVLVIWAATRWYKLDDKRNRVREQTFPNVTVVNVEGNHHVHLEHPERVEKEVLSFLCAPQQPDARL
mmetsp:Transcript_15962/g.62358  ORF Transcript_15962/g.62358 Transcript_15962/m.62358 type:complete len:303 (-) Transcript_15962:33-941(-)